MARIFWVKKWQERARKGARRAEQLLCLGTKSLGSGVDPVQLPDPLWRHHVSCKYTNTQIHRYTNTQIQIHKYTKSLGSDIDLVHLRAPLPPCVLQIQIRKYTNTQKVFDRVLTLLCGGTMCACAPCVCATKLSASELQKATKQLKLTFGPIFCQMTSFSAAKFENKLRVGLPKISGVQPRKVYSPSSGQLWRVAQKVESVRALPRRCRCCPIHAGMRLIMRMRMMIMMMGTI